MGFKINKKGDHIETSVLPLTEEEKQNDIKAMLQNKHFIFKEGLIDSEPEILSVSKLYFRQTKRIEIEIGGPKYIQNKMAQL
jgi:hypothetical protein